MALGRFPPAVNGRREAPEGLPTRLALPSRHPAWRGLVAAAAGA
jgi:hypothetical protein